jgi:hypothetical protein
MSFPELQKLHPIKDHHRPFNVTNFNKIYPSASANSLTSDYSLSPIVVLAAWDVEMWKLELGTRLLLSRYYSILISFLRSRFSACHSTSKQCGLRQQPICKLRPYVILTYHVQRFACDADAGRRSPFHQNFARTRSEGAATGIPCGFHSRVRSSKRVL